MKRSKINAVIKDMEKLINDHGFQLPPFVNGHRRTGMKKVMNMMRSETICWAGILQIMALENSMR